MRNRTPGPVLLSVALLAAGLAVAPVQGKGPGDPEAPITLRLLVADTQGRQSEPVAMDLVALAEEILEGAITIVPTFAGGDVATATMRRETDLGMVPSRDWDNVGVTSLDVLEAPFLIDDDALALAVATSDIAERAMAGLGAVGVEGLTMWPEDLRHLFVLDPSGADLSTPGGVAGADILVVAGQPGHDLITQLGGRIYEEGVAAGDLTGDRGVDAETGTLEGMVTGLWGAGLPTQDVTVAGDLVVYSKYQMLVANAGVLEGLTDRQRELLDQIVDALQVAALGRHFTEAELAVERCAAGGTVVTIGAAAVDAFKAAAQPLTDRLAADPVTGPLMADVAALAQQTPDAPRAGTCEPVVLAPSPSVAPAGSPSAGVALDIDGFYRAEVTREDLLAAGSSPEDAALFAGTITWTIGGGRWSLDFDPPHPQLDVCEGGIAPVATGFRITAVDADGCWGWDELGITPSTDGIVVSFVACGVNQGPGHCNPDVNRALFARHWIRIDGPAPSVGPVAPSADPSFIGDQPVPAGSYRVEATADQLRAAGSAVSAASMNAGVWTWTFTSDGWSAEHQPRSEHCHGAMSVVNGHVELTDVSAAYCALGYDLLWRPEGDGIRFHVLDLNWTQASPQELADERALSDRVWTRIHEAPASPGPVDDGALLPATDTTGWTGSLPPDGSYRAEVTYEDLLARGVRPDRARGNAATSTWTFKDGIATLSNATAGGVSSCQATAQPALDGTYTMLTDIPGGQCGIGAPLAWRPVEGGIQLLVVIPPGTRGTPDDLYGWNEYKAIIEDRVWVGVE